MESKSRSRRNPKRHKDVMMKSWTGSPMSVDTKNDKFKNATKKIRLSNINEEEKSN